MKRVGAHVSIRGGVDRAPLNARAIGARAFAMFTKNQRRWHAKPLTSEQITAFRTHLAEVGIAPRHVLPHDSYLINLAHPDSDGLEKSRAAFVEEMQRCATLGLELLNFHPGSHLHKLDERTALLRVAESIDLALEQVPGVTAVIETTAGQGSNLGHRFEQLATIIDAARNRERIGVCIDTCHIFVAGYDLRTEKACAKTFAEFDATVGFERLRGVHLNDSKPPLGARVDRHASLGEGELGWEPFRVIMNDARFDEIPMVLETPDDGRWKDEIARLYALVE